MTTKVLIARLRDTTALSDPLLTHEAADALEALGREVAAIRATQEPVTFLCDATRFKVRQHEGDEAGRIYGLPSELNGRWVALVAADDDCHLNPAASPKIGGV